MSTIENDNLIERAYDLIEYFAGKAQAQLLQNLIDTNDLEALQHYITSGEVMRFDAEFNPTEVYGADTH